MKKIKTNFFSAKKALSVDIAGYMNRSYIKRAETVAKYDKPLKNAYENIEKWQKILADVIHGKEKNYSVVDVQHYIDINKAKIDNLVSAKNSDLALVNAYEPSLALTTLKKDLAKIRKNGEGSIDRVVCEFFAKYDLEINNTIQLNIIMTKCIAYNTSLKSYIETDGKKLLLLDVNRTFNNIIAYTFEECVKAGTIKPRQCTRALKDRFKIKDVNKIAEKSA